MRASWRLGPVLMLCVATIVACPKSTERSDVDAGDCCGPGGICLCRDASVPPPPVRDASPDSWRPPPPPPPPRCQQGLPCTPDRGCASGECLAEFMTTIGSAMDPIDGLPGGATTIPNTYWVGGYCTSDAFARVGQPGACNLDAAPGTDDGCGACGACFNAGRDAMGLTATLCVATCTPSATTNSCRMGYQCAFGRTREDGSSTGACLPGCGSDAECRVYREDTNHDGTLDPGVDRLVYDVASMATCNVITGRCDQPAAPGAVAGIPCERDSQCEDNGTCRTELDSGWPGGYCTKRGCDVPGRECTGAGDVCQILDGRLCLQGCDVGNEPMADRLGTTGHGLGCRVGYACAWNGTDGATPNNGACVPGNYNGVTTNNVGAACMATSATDDPDLQCFSPFGHGRCITPDLWGGAPALPTGICTIGNCAAPGVDGANPCGPGAQCIGVGGSYTLCFKNCTTAADCPTGYACVENTATDPHICAPICVGDFDCTADRRCQIPAGEMIGRCVLR